MKKIIMLLLLLFLCSPACASEYEFGYHNKGIFWGGVSFSELDYAIDYMKPGDDLYIQSGEYILREPLIIDKNDIAVIGFYKIHGDGRADAKRPNIILKDSPDGLTLKGENNMLANLRFKNSEGIYATPIKTVSNNIDWDFYPVKNTWFERMDNFVESNPHWLWFKGILLVIVAALMIFSSLYRGKEEE